MAVYSVVEIGLSVYLNSLVMFSDGLHNASDGLALVVSLCVCVCVCVCLCVCVWRVPVPRPTPPAHPPSPRVASLLRHCQMTDCSTPARAVTALQVAFWAEKMKMSPAGERHTLTCVGANRVVGALIAQPCALELQSSSRAESCSGTRTRQHALGQPASTR
jgi:hypothetical protein